MPVSSISVVGVRSSTSGASRWIGHRSSVTTGSPRSMGSPSRLKMRPSVASPTGTVMGPPVSTTSVPRARPSVVSMATARSRSSPRCCCTSQTSVPASPRSIVMALLMWGSLSGNTASITTPWISSMRPTFLVCVAASKFAPLRLSKCLSPCDHFHDFLGDLSLSCAVHLKGEALDQVAGVVGRAAHRGHPRTVLGRGGFEQRAEHRDLDVVGNQPVQDLLRVRLVLDERVMAGVVLVVLVAPPRGSWRAAAAAASPGAPPA